MKYLRKFATEGERNAWQKGDDYVKPNVVLVGDTITFNAPQILLGVSILHIDGNLYTPEQWTSEGFANELANGVVVNADEACFVIAKNDLDEKMKWSGVVDSEVNGILTSNKNDVALTDFAGQQNTDLIVTLSQTGAAAKCASFTFPNGAVGYLPALGELAVAYDNKEAVDLAMNLIGGVPMGDYLYWASTQSSTYYAWGLSWQSGSVSTSYKNDKYHVRPFTHYSI